MAIVWFSRTSAYKLGVVGLLASSLLYLLGFGVPFWFQLEDVHYGLWLGCYRTDCYSFVGDRGLDSNLKAAQGVECLGLIGLIISQFYTVIANFRHTIPPHSRFLEVASAISGTCGFIGCMIFVGKTREAITLLAANYSWGFGLNLAGSILTVISAAIIGYGNQSDLVNH